MFSHPPSGKESRSHFAFLEWVILEILGMLGPITKPIGLTLKCIMLYMQKEFEFV